MLADRLLLWLMDRERDPLGALMLKLADMERLALRLPDCVTDRLIDRLRDRLTEPMPVAPHAAMR